MASQSTIQTLVALTVVNSSAELIVKQIEGEHDAGPVIELAQVVAFSVKEAWKRWPDLTRKEMLVFADSLKPIFDAIRETNGLPGHTLSWLSIIFLEHVTQGLLDSCSPKALAMHDVLEKIEELHRSMKSEDEGACEEQADRMFRKWRDAVNRVPVGPAWRRVA